MRPTLLLWTMTVEMMLTIYSRGIHLQSYICGEKQWDNIKFVSFFSAVGELKSIDFLVWITFSGGKIILYIKKNYCP